MEHTIIAPAAPRSAPIATIAADPVLMDALALQGLRELLFAPIPKLAAALAHLDREQLGQAIEVMVAMLDAADGDPDAEPVTWTEDPVAQHDAYAHDDDEDDDPAGQCDEDGINSGEHLIYAAGPGCTISDAPDPSVTEWHTRGRHKLHDGLTGVNGWRLGEDDEEDDGDTGAEDGPFDPEEDYGAEELGERDEAETGLCLEFGVDQTAGGIGYAPRDDRAMMRPHLDRIRRDACDRYSRYGQAYYRLRPSGREPRVGA